MSRLRALLFAVSTAMAASTIARAMPPVAVKTATFVGRLYAPYGVRPRPVGIVLIGGSEGHLYTADEIGPMLAAKGYVVLGVDYHDGFAGPRQLTRVPIETFVTAVDWLRASGRVDASRVVVLGQSRGGEAALMTAANAPSVAGVAAFVPSSVAWGSTEGDNASGWSLGGKPVAYIAKTGADGTGAAAFGRALARYPLDGPARIAVERTHGPVLLVGSDGDGVWPSGAMVRGIAARLAGHGFVYPATSLVFSDASHRLLGTGPSAVTETYTYPGGTYTARFGGTAIGTQAARDQSWQLLLSWLDFIARAPK